MARAYRTLVLWIFWSIAALVIYLGLYMDTDILEFLRSDDSRITWIIISLFVFGVVTSFFLSLSLTYEGIEAYHQHRLAKQHGLTGLQPSGKKIRAVNQYYDAVKVVAESNENPNLEALLDVEFAAHLRVSHATEVLGNLLITLGLIGTVLGLTYTLTGLTNSLEALGHDQDMLLAGLRKAMGGMGTAFYTTLLGAVLGGVLLRIFALITENGISGLHEYLLKTCMVYCAADFQQSERKDIRFLNMEIDALSDRLGTLQEAFSDSRRSMLEFRDTIKSLHELSGDDSGVYNLRETLRMQKFYRALLRQELTLMDKLNRSWWKRFKRHLIKR